MPGNRAEKADPFFEAAERQARLLGQLHKSPRVDLIGVVAPSGVGAGKLRGEKLWTITIGLEVWKPLGGTLRAKSLTIRTHGGNEELDSKRELIEPLTVVHLRALVAEESIFGSPQGLLVQFVGKFSSDAELNKIAEELKTPVTFVDSQFGIFTLDRCVNWFETETTWRGNPIVLTLNPEESSGVQSMLAVARTLWSSQSWRHQNIAACASRKLLAVKNKYWLEEGEPELSPGNFENRMTLHSISIYHDGRIEFSHDDGDLFYGHSIIVSGNLASGPTDARFEG